LGSIMSTVQWMGDLRTIYMASWRDTEDGIKMEMQHVGVGFLIAEQYCAAFHAILYRLY